MLQETILETHERKDISESAGDRSHFEHGIGHNTVQ